MKRPSIAALPAAFLAVLIASLAACTSSAPPHLGPPLRLEGDPEGKIDREAVLDVVQRAFDAIAAQGEEGPRMWEELPLDRGAMSTVRRRDGALATSVRTFSEHIQSTASAKPKQSYLERMSNPTVLVEGDIAVVWAPYEFWRGSERSHGGVDVITLLRTKGGWKIASLAWSVVPDYKLPLPPPAIP